MLVIQSCPTLFDPLDCSPPGSSVHGILQARILEWVAIFTSPGDFSDLGIEPRSPTLQLNSLPSESPGKPLIYWFLSQIFFMAFPKSRTVDIACCYRFFLYQLLLWGVHKFFVHQNHLEGLLKLILCFWFCRPGMGPENSDFEQLILITRGHTLGTVDIYHFSWSTHQSSHMPCVSLLYI